MTAVQELLSRLADITSQLSDAVTDAETEMAELEAAASEQRAQLEALNRQRESLSESIASKRRRFDELASEALVARRGLGQVPQLPAGRPPEEPIPPASADAPTEMLPTFNEARAAHAATHPGTHVAPRPGEDPARTHADLDPPGIPTQRQDLPAEVARAAAQDGGDR